MQKLFSVLFLSLFLFGTKAESQPVENPLEFKISADKELYTIGRDITLTLTIKNKGTTPVTLYDLDYPGAVTIQLVDAESVQIQPQNAGPAPKPSATMIKLDPGETRAYQRPHLRWYDASMTWEFREREQLPAHNYTIAATMTNPPRGFPSSKKSDNSWEGSVLSNRVKIRILEPSQNTIRGAYPRAEGAVRKKVVPR